MTQSVPLGDVESGGTFSISHANAHVERWNGRHDMGIGQEYGDVQNFVLGRRESE